MNDLRSELLRILCTGLGEGNTNTEKLTRRILAENSDMDPGRTKAGIIETLRELKDEGEIQIVTMGWELGQEFLFICSRRL